MSSSNLIPLPPHVHFIESRPTFYLGDPTGWHRASLEQSAYLRTGISTDPRESNVGIYVRRRQNNRYLLGFDLWRLPLKLRSEVVERLRVRWRAQVDVLPKPARNRIRFCGGCTSFELETTLDHVDGWKAVLGNVLSDPNSFEAIERRTETTP